MQNTDTFVPAAAGFYALFLSPEDDENPEAPRQLTCHPVVAWQVDHDHASAWPVCCAKTGGDYDFIEAPDGTFEHVTGFTCETREVALAYALDQERMLKEERAIRAVPGAAE